MSHRAERLAEQVRGEISRVLREECADPRIRLLTITRVKLARDLATAVVFWSPLAADDDVEALDEIADGLESAAGFVRSQLAANLNLRRTPALHFRHDASIAEGSRTLSLLRSLPDVGAPGEGDGAEAGAASEGATTNGEEPDVEEA